MTAEEAAIEDLIAEVLRRKDGETTRYVAEKARAVARAARVEAKARERRDARCLQALQHRRRSGPLHGVRGDLNERLECDRRVARAPRSRVRFETRQPVADDRVVLAKCDALRLFGPLPYCGDVGREVCELPLERRRRSLRGNRRGWLQCKDKRENKGKDSHGSPLACAAW